MTEGKCGPGCYLEWTVEGDKRLQCKRHNKWYALMNGKPTECEAPQ